MLSVILPTYNESENILTLLKEIAEALEGVPHEIIVVDDNSPDKTWQIADRVPGKVRVIRRIGRRGLSSAVVEGFEAAKGDVLAVMDGDGQHDPQILPKIYALVRRHNGLVLGSRYIEGGSVEGWMEPRHFMSRIATAFGMLVCTHKISDPMSGFFALDRSVYERIKSRLRPRGFKILLETVSWLPEETPVHEVPLVFRLRKAGKSKLNAKIEIEYLLQVLSLLLKGRGKLPQILFGLILLGSLLLMAPRIWNLRLLYLDPDVRAHVEKRLKEEEQWLLSDIAVLEVHEDWMKIRHQSHIRGTDPSACYVVRYTSPVLHPCPAS